MTELRHSDVLLAPDEEAGLIAGARDTQPVRGLTHGFYKYPARRLDCRFCHCRPYPTGCEAKALSRAACRPTCWLMMRTRRARRCAVPSIGSGVSFRA